MPKLYQLAGEATELWDEWHRQQAAANEANKQARRAKESFVELFGDRDRAGLADGRIICRVREARKGYEVPPKTLTRYIENPT